MKKITALICFCFLALQNKNLGYAPQLSADTLADIKGSTNPACLDTYGYILSRLGRLPEATKYLENAVDNGVDFTDQLIKKIQGLKNKQ